MNNPQVIGIRFSDNDFYKSITAFLETLNAIGLNNYENLTKEKVVELFNRSVPGLYWLYQNKMEYRQDWDASSYIRIEEKHVFFDDEVEKHIQKVKGNDNGEFFILDTQVFNSYVYSV